jgi:hypothetical protein
MVHDMLRKAVVSAILTVPIVFLSPLAARGSSNHFAAVNQSIGATTDEVFLRVQRASDAGG